MNNAVVDLLESNLHCCLIQHHGNWTRLLYSVIMKLLPTNNSIAHNNSFPSVIIDNIKNKIYNDDPSIR